MESPANTYQSVTGQSIANFALSFTLLIYVPGTLVVPHLRPATGGASTGIYGGSSWVGLDGMTCQTSLMATGIDFIYLNETIFANGMYG
jgi:hypothetical protein